MKEELLGPKVENVGVAVIQSINEEMEKEYIFVESEEGDFNFN